MMDLRKAVVPVVILFGASLLAGCGDTAGDADMDTTTDPIMEDTMAPTP
ncbi:MAG: hypothetical protein ACK4MD_07730 [Demequina sp.]